MPRPARPAPASFSQKWPEEACIDARAEKVRLLALNVRRAMGNRSLRAAATDAGVDHTVLADILNGASWPDVRTVAVLELAFNQPLWPHHGASEA